MTITPHVLAGAAVANAITNNIFLAFLIAILLIVGSLVYLTTVAW